MKETLVILQKIKEELAGGIGFDFDGVLSTFERTIHSKTKQPLNFT